MKKILLLAAVAVLAAPAASFAQKTTVTRVNREKAYRTSSRSVDIWYEGELNIGYGTGRLPDQDIPLDTEGGYARPLIETVHGVRITKYAFIGLGLGFQYAYDWDLCMMPVFVNLKGYYPVTKHLAPYISVDLGVSSKLAGGTKSVRENLDPVTCYKDINLKGGFYASCGVGLNYKRLNFGLGWQHQSMKNEYTEEIKNVNGNSYGRTYYGEDGFGVNSFFVKVGLKF